MKTKLNRYKELDFLYAKGRTIETKSIMKFCKQNVIKLVLCFSLILNIGVLYGFDYVSQKNHRYVATLHKTEAVIDKVTNENRRVISFQKDSPDDAIKIGSIMHDILSTCDNSTEEKFLTEVLPHAIRFQIQKNIPASALIAQAIYESGYGRSKLAIENHNYFGLKALEKNVPYTMMTTTDSGVVHLQPFRKFANAYDGFCGYYKFLSASGRYDNAFSKTTGVGFVRTILADGYCPNQNYLDDIKAIIIKHHLDKLENVISNHQIEQKEMASYTSR
jgi:flagellum-specific peptidoglycan hydrolase FlgJ